MKVRRLTIDVLYDEAHADAVEICLDKMTTDWLIRPEVECYDTALSDPPGPRHRQVGLLLGLE